MTGPIGASARLWAGLDIGGSKVHAVAVDDAGEVLAEHRAVSRGGTAGILGTAGAALAALARDARRPVGAFAAVGVGVPGLVDTATGSVSHAVNLGLDGTPLRLRDRLAELPGLAGVPVAVENDVNAAALGAARLLALDVPDLAYLGIGTGLAAGLLLGGRLRRGLLGSAGEVGHVPVDPAGPRCSCGQCGCLEVLVSGAAIARAWPGPPGTPAAEALFAAADAGDARARAVRTGVVAHVAAAVRLVVLTVDVELVVLGGGVAELGERLAEPVREHLERSAAVSPYLRGLDLPGRVVTVPPGPPVAALGAALAGRARAGQSPPALAVPGGRPWRS